MASHSLLRSIASSFYGHSRFLTPTLSVRLLHGNPINGHGVVPVKTMAEIVLVEKLEAQKAYRLKDTYREIIIPLLIGKFNYTNIHQIPKVYRVVVKCEIGDAAQNAKDLDAAMTEIALITGQRPMVTRDKNSVANFKIREGQPLGIAVTILRGNAMYSFLERLINLGLPRTRDFTGLFSNSFDEHGNYSVGIREQSVFPETRFDALGKPRVMDICIATTAKSDKEGQMLLALMGMPFSEGGDGPLFREQKKKLKSHHFDKKGGKGRR